MESKNGLKNIMTLELMRHDRHTSLSFEALSEMFDLINRTPCDDCESVEEYNKKLLKAYWEEKGGQHGIQDGEGCYSVDS